jgi:hypothetical protein
MNIRDIQNCADYFQEKFLETFYLVSTYNGRSFMLVGEKENFPHLVGIAKNVYKSHGYSSPKKLYRDILNRSLISTNINNIATTSKMYKKVVNFRKSANIFWRNQGPLAVNYNMALSNKQLNVDVLISDIKSGYMLGWTVNTNIIMNAEILLKKFCISSWIDESGGNISGKEKYLPSQDVELIRHVFSFNKHSDLLKQREYKYNAADKKDILLALERNNANLLVNASNERFYVELAKRDGIRCGFQY